MKLASRFLGPVLFALLVIAPAIAAGPFTVVVDGLKNPRGLTFGPGGRLYVAQAGFGGATATGKITEIRYPWRTNPTVRDVVSGLISITTPEGDFVSAAGLSAIGNGTIYAAMEVSNAGTGFPSLLGHLLKVCLAARLCRIRCRPAQVSNIYNGVSFGFYSCAGDNGGTVQARRHGRNSTMPTPVS